MRSLISFLIGMVAATAAAVVGLGISVAQQGQSAQFTFLGMSLQADQRWVVAGAVALGFLLALLLAALLLIPDRVASARRSGALSRYARALEEQLRTLREQYAQLQGGYRNLLEEHQRVMGQVLPSGAAAPPTPVPGAMEGHAPVVSSAIPATVTVPTAGEGAG
jgi:uncharacterized membrane protein YgaE (UPF0421/DUF939 family)